MVLVGVTLLVTVGVLVLVGVTVGAIELLGVLVGVAVGDGGGPALHWLQSSY